MIALATRDPGEKKGARCCTPDSHPFSGKGCQPLQRKARTISAAWVNPSPENEKCSGPVDTSRRGTSKQGRRDHRDAGLVYCSSVQGFFFLFVPPCRVATFLKCSCAMVAETTLCPDCVAVRHRTDGYRSLLQQGGAWSRVAAAAGMARLGARISIWAGGTGGGPRGHCCWRSS